MKRRVTPCRADPRDLRLAVFGAGCTALGGVCLLLAACSTDGTRPEHPAPQPAVPPTVAMPVPAPPAPEEEKPVSTPAPLQSPWPRLRATFVLPACDFDASVRRWTRTFARSPDQFAGSLAEAMPYLLLVTDELGKRHMPGEFAFLPYLESNYVPIAASGDRAAGIWQLMPDTAIEAGLPVGPDYDGRLDIYASTVAAIGLLQQYHEEFDDWRLADMAFNAGLYGVRQLASGTPRHEWTARELERLAVPPGTHDHLAKLLALSCIVSDPQRHHVRLPEPKPRDALALLELPAPVDLQLAARLAGIDLAQLRRLNPGFLRGRMPEQGPFRLLVPATQRVGVEATLGRLPQYMWRSWHAVVLKRPETLDLFAMLADVEPAALAAINGLPADATLAPGTHLLLPGPAAGSDSAIVENAPPPDELPPPQPDALVVRAGDTLWDIAHRYGLHVDDLQRWNGLPHGATLRLGQRLLLNAPARSR
jgi:membrane-bound lytic murein transglycosylase D